VPPGGSPEAAAAIMGKIHVPVGYVNGGPQDISTAYIRQDYAALPSGVPAYAAHRSEGDHITVSVAPAVQPEVAEISTNWIDFALYGSPALARSIVADPCSSCPPGTWSAEAKNLAAASKR